MKLPNLRRSLVLVAVAFSVSLVTIGIVALELGAITVDWNEIFRKKPERVDVSEGLIERIDDKPIIHDQPPDPLFRDYYFPVGTYEEIEREFDKASPDAEIWSYVTRDERSRGLAVVVGDVPVRWIEMKRSAEQDGGLKGLQP